jgi:DNA topoisomerase II
MRFVMDVIEGRLVVSHRRREELLEELEKKGFAPLSKSASAVTTRTSRPSDDFEIEEIDSTQEKTQSDQGHRGYDYLLSMPIWSLTWERVQQLKAERENTQHQLSALLALTPKAIWKQDLERFLVEWEAFEQMDKTQEIQVPATLATGKTRKKTGTNAATTSTKIKTSNPLSLETSLAAAFLEDRRGNDETNPQGRSFFVAP